MPVSIGYFCGLPLRRLTGCTIGVTRAIAAVIFGVIYTSSSVDGGSSIPSGLVPIRGLRYSLTTIEQKVVSLCGSATIYDSLSILRSLYGPV
jgi:hypothetical protein